MLIFSNLDTGSWFYGLVAAFIGGGSGSVSAAFGLMLTDPEHYSIAHPGKMLEVMAWTFLLPGLTAGFAYLKQNPLPTQIKTTTEKVELVRSNPPAILTTTVETKETK